MTTGRRECARESTGSYWKPVFNILEDSVEVVLANAYDVQNRRGHKTDPNDSRWLAHLLRHGMIRASFIPERAVRELRDLTRQRKQLVGEKAREHNLASIGHPLVGDPLYGLTGQSLENLPGLPGDGGYFLHAQFLKFHHPITGEQINLEAALPTGFSLHQ